MTSRGGCGGFSHSLDRGSRAAALSSSSSPNRLRLSRPHVQELPNFATEVVGHYDLVCPVCQSLPILLLGQQGHERSEGEEAAEAPALVVGCEENSNPHQLMLLDELVELAEEDEVLEEMRDQQQESIMGLQVMTVELSYARRCFSERWVAYMSC